MRNQLLRLTKRNSNKSERRIGEILKKNKIKFKVKQRIGKYECDFKVGRVILEIDGKVHKQTNREKDIYLVSRGYTPLHIQAGKYGKELEKEILYLIKTNNTER